MMGAEDMTPDVGTTRYVVPARSWKRAMWGVQP